MTDENEKFEWRPRDIPFTEIRCVEVIDHKLTGSSCRSDREKSGLSLREVARRLSLSASFVSDLELGRRNWTKQLYQRYRKSLERKD